MQVTCKYIRVSTSLYLFLFYSPNLIPQNTPASSVCVQSLFSLYLQSNSLFSVPVHWTSFMLMADLAEPKYALPTDKTPNVREHCEYSYPSLPPSLLPSPPSPPSLSPSLPSSTNNTYVLYSYSIACTPQWRPAYPKHYHTRCPKFLPDTPPPSPGMRKVRSPTAPLRRCRRHAHK